MDQPCADSTPEQLAALEQKWTEMYYGETRNPDWEIHPSEWLPKCADKVTEGRTGLRWFVPLCEKAPAMKWLYDQGHYVIGVELIGKAIEEFFEKYEIKFTKPDVPELKFGCLYQSEDKKIQIFKCNIFDVTRDLIGGPIDAVWDRGALQALPERDRKRYGEVIFSLLAPSGRILAETFERTEEKAGEASTDALATASSEISSTAGNPGDSGSEQHEDEFPNHSVTDATIKEIYGGRCTIDVLATEYWGEKCDVVTKDQPHFAINTVRLITLK